MRRLNLRRVLSVLGLVCGVLLAASMEGCGGGGQSLIGGSPATAITLDAGTSVALTATVVNDSSMEGATFALSGPGSLGTSTCTSIAGSTQCALYYNAPATVTAATAVTVTATSVHTPSQSVSFSITVNPALVFTTSATLPNAAVNQAYTTTIAAAGGTGASTFALATGSTLPAGLTLSSTGVLSGKPATAGTYTFAVKVTDTATTPNVVLQTETLLVSPAPPVITTTSQPNAATGVAYSQQLAFSGGTGTGVYSIVSGALPVGLTLSASGLISGTPTTAAGGQTYSFTVQVVSGTQTSATQALSILVTSPPIVTTTTLPPATTASVYSQQLNYSAGNGGAVSWAITAGTLPTGITLSTSGLLSGKPTQLGSFAFSVAVTVGGQTSASQALTLTVSNLAITSSATASGEVGLAFRMTETLIGGVAPYTWTRAAGSNPLPGGLTLAATGVIRGTPTIAGTTTVTIQVTDSTGSFTTQALAITINAARTNVNNAALSGQYAFLLSGFDATGAPATAGGTFIADGAGHITSGTIDTNGTALATPSLNQPLAATVFNIGADGRGTVTLTTGPTSYVFTVALQLSTTPAAGGYMNEFDATGRTLSGVALLQSPTTLTTAGVTGGYAFGMQGFAASAAIHTGIIGELQTTGATGTVNSGEVISTILGSSALPTTAGTYAITAGRGTASLTFTGGSKLNLVLYPVSATQVLLFSADASSLTTPVMTGQARAQTIANGSFAATSLNGVSVLRLERVVNTSTTSTVTTASDVVLGLETFSGAGTSTLAGDENNAGVSSTVNTAAKDTVAANGRVALTPANGIGGCVNCSTTQLLVYLWGVNSGFVLDFGSGSGTGMLEAQTAGTLSSTYAAGSVQPIQPGTLLDATVAAGNGTLSFVADTAAVANLSADQALAYNATAASTGRITLTGPSSEVLYEISPTRFVGVDLLALQPILYELQR